MTKTKTTLPVDIEPETRFSSNAPASVAKQLRLEDLGADLVAEGGVAWWRAPDARERDEPIRILRRVVVPGDGMKTLPNGAVVRVLAAFDIEVMDKGEQRWEVLSRRALQALNTLPDLSSWFVVKSKGSQTDKTYTARPWVGERDA